MSLTRINGDAIPSQLILCFFCVFVWFVVCGVYAAEKLRGKG